MAEQPGGTNGHTAAPEIVAAMRQVLGEMLPEPPALPLSDYVLVTLKDDKAFRGVLVGNSFDQPYLELRGAQIAEFSTTGEMRWKTLDWGVLIYRADIAYIQRRA